MLPGRTDRAFGRGRTLPGRRKKSLQACSSQTGQRIGFWCLEGVFKLNGSMTWDLKFQHKSTFNFEPNGGSKNIRVLYLSCHLKCGVRAGCLSQTDQGFGASRLGACLKQEGAVRAGYPLYVQREPLNVQNAAWTYRQSPWMCRTLPGRRKQRPSRAL